MRRGFTGLIDGLKQARGSRKRQPSRPDRTILSSPPADSAAARARIGCWDLQGLAGPVRGRDARWLSLASTCLMGQHIQDPGSQATCPASASDTAMTPGRGHPLLWRVSPPENFLREQREAPYIRPPRTYHSTPSLFTTPRTTRTTVARSSVQRACAHPPPPSS